MKAIEVEVSRADNLLNSLLHKIRNLVFRSSALIAVEDALETVLSDLGNQTVGLPFSAIQGRGQFFQGYFSLKVGL